MKTNILAKHKVLLSCLIVLLCLGGVGVWKGPSIHEAYWMYRVRSVSSALPSCDRVEVFHLDANSDADQTGFPVRPYEDYSRILDQKTLTGSDAEALAALWRGQRFGDGSQALCHDPVYGFRFYRGSTLLFETSVCFHCRNFYVTVLGDSSWWGFDSGSPQAVNLLKRLQEIFPESNEHVGNP